jgi:hypothetical protein
MDDDGLTSKLEKAAPIATNGGDTLGRTSAMLNAGLRYWQTECLRLAAEAAADQRATFTRLLESKTPLDVLSAEHDWLRARSRSFLESGLRLIDAFAATTRGAKGDAVDEPSRRKRERAA